MTIDLVKLKAGLTFHEGKLHYVYDDANGKPIVKGTTVVGNPTIGVGRLLTAAHGLSDGEISQLLDNDIQSAIWLSQQQQWWANVSGNDARARAFVEILFGLGVRGLDQFSEALSAAMQSDWGACAAQFRNSEWYSEVGSDPGERGFVLTNMIETGEDPY